MFFFPLLFQIPLKYMLAFHMKNNTAEFLMKKVWKVHNTTLT